jgi:Zn-dependent peptidase ImmA (M78 family)
MVMHNDDTTESLDNFCKIFLTIKQKTNEILSEYDEVDYLKNPAIDIITIAKDNGIKVVFVPPEVINYERAILDDRDKDNITIKVNRYDAEEQFFSIAHELEHYFKKKAELFKESDLFEYTDLDKKNAVLEKTNKLKKSYIINSLAARTGNNYRIMVEMIKKIKGIKIIAQYISKTVTQKLGKDVSIEKVYTEFAKLLITNPIKDFSDSSYILKTVNKVYEEEIADYFAANLIVPSERFTLWENKSDKKIAKVFKVSEACIKKRRKEIIRESKFIGSKYSLCEKTNKLNSPNIA